jgi:hypothetical protein
MKNIIFNRIKQFFICIVATRFNRKCSSLNVKLNKSDDFDKKFGFILKYDIDDEKSYNKVKNQYFHTLSTSAKDNAHYSVKHPL